jgi:hypothetical protein
MHQADRMNAHFLAIGVEDNGMTISQGLPMGCDALEGFPICAGIMAVKPIGDAVIMPP